MDLDISDFVDWCAYFGLADPGQDLLLVHVEPDQVVVDVGANNGYLSLRLGQRVGRKGKVIAFEPHPDNVARCRRNYSLNTMEHVELMPLGLGDAEGESTMSEVRAANAGMNRMAPTAAQVATGARVAARAQVAQAEGTTVRITTLDAYLQEREMKSRDSPASAESSHSGDGGHSSDAGQAAAATLPIDWIKIDVEGYEARVLRGAAATIARCRPGLFIEVDDANLRAQDDSAAGLLKWVEAAGYDILDAATGRRVVSGPPLEGCHFDALCVHRGHPTEH